MEWHPTERDVNTAARIGTAFGLMLMLILAMIYLNVRNYQPMPECYEDEVIMWSGDTNTHDRCVPLDVLIIEEQVRPVP